MSCWCKKIKKINTEEEYFLDLFLEASAISALSPFWKKIQLYSYYLQFPVMWMAALLNLLFQNMIQLGLFSNVRYQYNCKKKCQCTLCV